MKTKPCGQVRYNRKLGFAEIADMREMLLNLDKKRIIIVCIQIAQFLAKKELTTLCGNGIKPVKVGR